MLPPARKDLVKGIRVRIRLFAKQKDQCYNPLATQSTIGCLLGESAIYNLGR